MKKELKAVICVVLSIWFFFMGFELGSYREKKKTVAQPSVQTSIQTNPPTTAAQTAAATTAAPAAETTAAAQTTAAQNGEQTTAAQSSQEQTTKKDDAQKDPSQLSKAEILAAAKKAIDGVKAEQNMTAVQTESTKITVTDCSLPSAVGMINSIISKMAGDDSATYQFSNGQATGVRPDGSAVKDEGVVAPTQVIPPKNKNFELTEAGVAEATAAKDGENTVYTLKLAAEQTTLESPVPTHNSAAIGYLDLAKLDISGVTITKADMSYPGSTVTTTVNSDGKLVKLELELPMSGFGEAKIFVGSGSASFEGGQHETWTFSY